MGMYGQPDSIQLAQFLNLGWQETVVIFVLALLIFGPKKLPQLGKDLGKAMSQFRRATSDLKSTWDREMANVDREGGLTETARELDRQLTSAQIDHTYHGTDHGAGSGTDSGYDHGYGVDPLGQPVVPETATETSASLETEPSTNGATATQGAETYTAEQAKYSSELAASAGVSTEVPVHVENTIAREKPKWDPPAPAYPPEEDVKA